MTSFEEYARVRGPGLVRFAAAVTADPVLAEDVVQDVLIRVHRDWERVASMASTDAYVRRAVVNEYLSWRRKWARVVPHARVPDDADGADFADGLVMRSELVGRIAKLPARQRVCLVLRYYEGRSDSEIAQLLDCRAVTVRGYVSRAVRALRIEMTATPPDSEEDDHAERDRSARSDPGIG